MMGTGALRHTVAIDFLYLDLEVCTRCRATDANLETALTTVDRVLESAGADVRAILSEVYGQTTTSASPGPREVPENLLRLFRSRQPRSEPVCCDARQQESCCEQSQKASCCGPRKEADARACGCQ
jgi:Domain of unknown function (DUF2703)